MCGLFFFRVLFFAVPWSPSVSLRPLHYSCGGSTCSCKAGRSLLWPFSFSQSFAVKIDVSRTPEPNKPVLVRRLLSMCRLSMRSLGEVGNRSFIPPPTAPSASLVLNRLLPAARVVCSLVGTTFDSLCAAPCRVCDTGRFSFCPYIIAQGRAARAFFFFFFSYC